ncbi:dihydrolipoyl dehydrogenase [Haloferula sp. BvORR071]|uniref:dihydrolipoyl dehydrogenase n=1 Tax=Haloferula sp. BvORR071 TaxID=1396141 RepID=UPI0005569381|nr:dihydrolipoyl dehydrogenase [Haloferula sp. BvORR071]
MAYDLIVIGGGPAGYVAAIRAAQLGKKVACVEADRAGGTCLNWGCIPTKALLKNAELFHTLSHRAKEFGFSFDNLQYDWSAVIGRSRTVSNKLAGGIEFLFKKNKVDYVRGFGSIAAAGKVEVTAADGTKSTLEAKHIIIATGAKSRPLPPLPFNGTTVIGSKEAMVLEKQPKSMIIIGAGAIGVEFAYIYNAFGTKVTVVEMLPRLVPVEDDEIGDALEKSFTKQGIRCLANHKITKTEVKGNQVEVTVEGAKEKGVLTADVVLVAIGVQPVLPGPGGVQPTLTDRGFVQVGDRYETSIPGVYAIGDVSGPPLLAHTASFEAIQCVDGLYVEGHVPRKVTVFPGCTYCHPQIASVGKTERALKEEGIEYKVGKIPFVAIGKAIASGEPDGFAKLLYGKKHGELLGAHIIGENATELIAEMGLALDQELTADEIHATIHAHPTMSEVIHEATLAADGHAIHF